MYVGDMCILKQIVVLHLHQQHMYIVLYLRHVIRTRCMHTSLQKPQKQKDFHIKLPMGNKCLTTNIYDSITYMLQVCSRTPADGKDMVCQWFMYGFLQLAKKGFKDWNQKNKFCWSWNRKQETTISALLHYFHNNNRLFDDEKTTRNSNMGHIIKKIEIAENFLKIKAQH